MFNTSMTFLRDFPTIYIICYFITNVTIKVIIHALASFTLINEMLMQLRNHQKNADS